MKILPAASIGVLKAPLVFSLCLIHGDDVSKVTDLFHKVSKNAGFDIENSFTTSSLSFKEVMTNHDVLLNKINTLTFDGNMRLIHISDVGQALSVDLQEIFNNIDYNATYIILTANKFLSAKSSTRIYFEKSKKCASIACYADDESGVKHSIKIFLQDRGVRCSDSLMDLLSSHLIGEKKNIHSELEKLLFYISDLQSINEEDVMSSINQNFQSTVDEVCFAFADKNIYRFLSLISEHKNSSLILRSLIRYFCRLYSVLVELRNGTPLQCAIKTLRPNIFFRNLQSFKRHIELWQINAISMMFSKLLDIETTYNRDDSKTQLMLKHLALNIHDLT